VIICLRDSNKRARKVAAALFKRLSLKMLSLGLIDDFLQMVLAGLAGNSSLAKAASISACASLLRSFKSQLSATFVQEISAVIFLLI